MWGSSVAPTLPRESSPDYGLRDPAQLSESLSPHSPQLLRSSPQKNQGHTRKATKQESPAREKEDSHSFRQPVGRQVIVLVQPEA